LNSRANNRKAIVFTLVSMAAFSIEDAFIKHLSSTHSIAQILIVIGLASAIFFAILALKNGRIIWASGLWTRLTFTRMLAEAFAGVAFVTSLSLVPLSTVAAVFQILPLTVTMGSALCLGERVGWRGWAAIFVGFVGVLLIIKPGFEAFNPSVLLVLVAVLGIAVRDLVTRVIPDSVGSSIISFQAFSSVVVAGLFLLLVSPQVMTPIALEQWVYFGFTIVFSVSGYYAIVLAMRLGAASIVAPFRYSRLLFSLMIGVFIFKEQPDALTLTGCGIIIVTGFYTYLREQRGFTKRGKNTTVAL
jgi:drug/metabolite transporter (DMT)-like permease